MMLTIQMICDTIILAGAVVVAIVNIVKFFAKPTSVFKRKAEEEFQRKIKKALEEYIPPYLDKRDKENKEQQLQEQQKIFSKMKTEMTDEIKAELQEIKTLNEKQNQDIILVKKQAVDMLRQKIEAIYYKYRAEKILPQFQLENLQELFKDYKKGGGNHHIDKLYNRMLKWQISDELPEYDKE